MLSTLLSSTVQTQLFSKALWISNALPWILFLTANLAMCKLEELKIYKQLTDALSQEKSFAYAVWLLVVLVGSYVLSTLNTALLEILEGKRPPVRWLHAFLYPGQLSRLRTLDQQYDVANAGYIELDKGAERLVARLNAALRYRGRARRPPEARPLMVDEIYRRYCLGQPTSPGALWEAARALSMAIVTTSANAPVAQILHEDANKLKVAARFSRDRFLADRQRLYNQRQFTFPGEYPSRDVATSLNVLAPTRFGNIGLTMRSYALLRYQLDLNVFWGRLQSTIETTAKSLFERLSDSKVRVDALVMLFWLTLVFTASWTIGLAVYRRSLTTTLWTIGLGGPLLAFMWYELACQSYTVMADLVRTSVDVCRFGLLRDFSLTPPMSSVDKPSLWLSLGNAIGYNAIQGADQPPVFHYEHKKS